VSGANETEVVIDGVQEKYVSEDPVLKNTCWAAASATVLRFLGFHTDTQELLAARAEVQCENVGPAQCSNSREATFKEAAQATYDVLPPGTHIDLNDHPALFGDRQPDVREILDGRIPFVLMTTQRGHEIGHAYVVYGARYVLEDGQRKIVALFALDPHVARPTSYVLDAAALRDGVSSVYFVLPAHTELARNYKR